MRPADPSGNVRLVKGDAALSSLQGPFDLVHSALVLQHIPSATGLPLTKRLIELAGNTGVVVLHVLYDNPLRRALPVRLVARALRPLRRVRGRLPEIQMNPYPLNAVFKLIQDVGVRRIDVEFTDHAVTSAPRCTSEKTRLRSRPLAPVCSDAAREAGVCGR